MKNLRLASCVLFILTIILVFATIISYLTMSKIIFPIPVENRPFLENIFGSLANLYTYAASLFFGRLLLEYIIPILAYKEELAIQHLKKVMMYGYVLAAILLLLFYITGNWGLLIK